MQPEILSSPSPPGADPPSEAGLKRRILGPWLFDFVLHSYFDSHQVAKLSVVRTTLAQSDK